MNECLVTKLKSVVTDNEIGKMDEFPMFRITANSDPNIALKTFEIHANAVRTFRTVDGKILYNNSGNQLGSNIVDNIAQVILKDEGEYKMFAGPKYKCFKFIAGPSLNLNGYDIANFKYSPITSIQGVNFSGNLADISDLALEFFNARECQHLKGDLASFKNLANMNALIITGVSGKRLNVTAPLSIIANGSTKLTNLTLSKINVTGDIANVKNLTSLVDFVVEDASDANAAGGKYNVYGDVANLRNTKIAFCGGLKHTSVSGDLAKLPSICRFFSAIGNDSTFTWSNRGSSESIIGLQQVKLGDNVDTMLINQASCTATTSTEAASKRIDVYGNRTSSSDSAVSTLKNKGYTVMVNGITL